MLKGSSTEMSSSAMQRTENPLRPGIGTSGTQIQVQVNIYPITALGNVKAYQYDVTFKPDIPPSVTRTLWNQVESKIRKLPSMQRALLAYDGKKNAFSTTDICSSDSPVILDVGSERETFKVTLKKSATMQMHSLLLFTQKKAQETEEVLHALTCLSTVLLHLPSMMYTNIGSNCFTPQNKTPISGGLEIWRGYHQSIRAMMAGHLGINV
jgi:eukaryotic translation initiation factor 2C